MKVVNAICWIVVKILGFAIDRGWELWLNVRSKLCVKPSNEGGLYGVQVKHEVRMVLCKFSKQFILAL